MNFMLKIVEGPNKGAEIALVEGVAVTLGKGDDCDIILVDPTLPDTPLNVQATDVGVMVGGEELPPFHVKTVGATSFAVGPGDAPWRDLVWPKTEKEKQEEAPAQEPAKTDTVEKEPAPGNTVEDQPAVAEKTSKSRRGGCVLAFVLLLIVIGVACWCFRAAVKEFYETRIVNGSGGRNRPEAVELTPLETLRAIAERYSLDVSEDDGAVRLSGNLDTRAKRLRATAEAYAAKPGVIVDISDDESFRVSADDALFTLTEGALKVVSASNRVISIAGTVRSSETLGRVLKALSSDMPKLKDVDVSGVVVSAAAAPIAGEIAEQEGLSAGTENPAPRKAEARKAEMRKNASGAPDLPVCGILTTPYPCLVMRNGTRIMEGASIGESVILKIESDAVTVTNSTGRFIWKP